jgi:hypothetical protein
MLAAEVSKEMKNTWFCAAHRACATVASGGYGPSSVDMIWFSVFLPSDPLKKHMASK